MKRAKEKKDADHDPVKQKIKWLESYVKSIKTDVMKEVQNTRDYFQNQVDNIIDQMTGQETLLKT